MTDRPTFLEMPKFIYLMNGTPPETNLLARQIGDLLPMPSIEQFCEPVISGVVGIYYPDNPYDGYIAFDKPAEQAKNSKYSLSTLKASLRGWLEQKEGRAILGQLALDRLESSYELFSNFIFPDADHGGEIEPLLKRFPDESLLVLGPSMTVPSALREGPIDVIYAAPSDLLARLSHRYEKEPEA